MTIEASDDAEKLFMDLTTDVLSTVQERWKEDDAPVRVAAIYTGVLVPAPRISHVSGSDGTTSPAILLKWLTTWFSKTMSKLARSPHAPSPKHLTPTLTMARFLRKSPALA